MACAQKESFVHNRKQNNSHRANSLAPDYVFFVATDFVYFTICLKYQTIGVSIEYTKYTISIFGNISQQAQPPKFSFFKNSS